MKLTGIFASIPTPFDHRGDLYTTKIQQNVGRWNRTSLSGYLVCGAAGEGGLLTVDEKVQVWEQVAAAAKSDATLLAATGAESVRETVTLSDRAAEIGYTAVVIAPPRCVAGVGRGPGMLRVYYQSVADASRVPVIVENSADGPDRRLSTEPLRVLAQHPNIIAVRQGADSSRAGDSPGRVSPTGYLSPSARVRSMDSESSELQILAGDACGLVASLDAGACGAILDFAAAVPFLCLSAEEAVRTRQAEAAKELQGLMAHPARALATQYGIAGLKFAMDLQGYYGGSPRLPGLPINADGKKHIENLFREISG